MKINYFKLREMYNDEDLINFLHNHYYYIVDKVYYRNNGTIEKELIELKLKELIKKYINDVNKSINPSKFFHDRIVCFENVLKNDELKDKQLQLIKKAYLNDINARQQIFMKKIDKIDKKAEELYSTMGNVALITLEDIKQIMYLDMWKFTIKFYDKENTGIYFSTEFMKHLNNLSNRISNYLNKELLIQENINIENVKYSDSYFVDSIENKQVLDIIAQELDDKYRTVFESLRRGDTYEYAGSQIGVTRSRVNTMNNRVKRIVKEKKIEW